MIDLDAKIRSLVERNVPRKDIVRACTHKSSTLIDVRLAPTSGAKADIS